MDPFHGEAYGHDGGPKQRAAAPASWSSGDLVFMQYNRMTLPARSNT